MHTHAYIHRQDKSLAALAYEILQRTQRTVKCILRGLASGGINPPEQI